MVFVSVQSKRAFLVFVRRVRLGEAKMVNLYSRPIDTTRILCPSR